MTQEAVKDHTVMPSATGAFMFASCVGMSAYAAVNVDVFYACSVGAWVWAGSGEVAEWSAQCEEE